MTGSIDVDVVKAFHQADSLCAKMVLNGDAEVIQSSDTDYGPMLGPDHFVIRSARNESTKDGVDEFLCNIAGYHNDLMEKLQREIKAQRIQWEPAINPVFSHTDHIIRSYAAIVMGCDDKETRSRIRVTYV